MLPPHECLEKLDALKIKQEVIAKKTGVTQSSISRIHRQLFKRPNWEAVERIQSLYKHACVDKKAVSDFPDFEDFIAKKHFETTD